MYFAKKFHISINFEIAALITYSKYKCGKLIINYHLPRNNGNQHFWDKSIAYVLIAGYEVVRKIPQINISTKRNLINYKI